MREQLLSKTKVWGKIDNRRVLSVTVGTAVPWGAGEVNGHAKTSSATPSYDYLALLIVFPVIAVGVDAYVL